jgi:hypothetical protein
MDFKTDIIIDSKNQATEILVEVVDNEQRPNTSWAIEMWQKIAQTFNSHNEPIFWKKRDRQGNSWWQGYDPVNNRILEFGSEEEARYWLD